MPGARGTGIGGQLQEQAAGCAGMGEGHKEQAGRQPLPRSLSVKPVCLFSPCPMEHRTLYAAGTYCLL